MLRTGDRDAPIRFVRPRADDPRLTVALVITALQVLGQAGLGFKLSISQILVPVAVCGVIDVAWSVLRTREVALPASGMLAGNGIAFILRAAGTKHGAWWSTNGLVLFVAAALVASVSKYAIRVDGRNVFNPSNLGLVTVFVATGVTHAFPQYLWWGPTNVSLIAAWVVIAVGALFVLRRLHMIPMVASFLATFGILIAGLAFAGRGFFARWSDARLVGGSYWAHICLSPELLVFACFMLSDPQTAPRSPRGRRAYGAAVAFVAAALCYPQTTEFGVKLAILSSLAIVCASMAVARAFPQRKRVIAVVMSVGVAVGALTVRTAFDPRVVNVEHPPGGSSGTASQ